VSHPFAIVKLFPRRTVTETLRFFVSRYRIPEDHIRTFYMSQRCA